VVVVESDAALEALPGTAVCMMIDETHGAPDTVVTIPMTHPVRGAAVAIDLTALSDQRLRAGELLGTVGPETMDRISAALRVTLDLT
jgi:mRNA interferase MazF